ncbi:Tm-1-like ATP-binding domain-containing protein [Verrucomicrobiaceae bacterium 5K15]|uniref:Tm-1-like ATP-binding domain-containing protein n=1 Tax=Oceaniferula flava TaxID=2800421 RepID=A0AAE2VCU0_9BACT|nr:Tm-1-like ATP-binding domain-containing protein [Oceaniferula flavus]MBK1855476.1 Tm-1-like ATP-binding domain-containing protein [Oceaniferula flavus]MBM1136782.1 Tm-1-like ATP-binding domain-containing protein [Oceaniferula flavus]
MNIAVIGTLDSKGHEHQFVADQIRRRGHDVTLIDLGTGTDPQVTPDITRYQVAEAAGLDLQPLLDAKDRGACVVAMAEAAPVLVKQLQEKGAIDAIISLGGGGGTALATACMRELPIGFPKVMVSTLASGNTAHYLGTKDITMIPSIVDVAGLNSVSKMIFARAAGAVCGMVETTIDASDDKPLIAASMFGNTTDCINIAKDVLEDAGYEVLVFHATGAGGKTMEALIESGMVKGVLDITTTEWADELTGATLSAGPTRMDAMSKAKIPAVVSPGCLDMANFGEPDTVPEQYADRLFYIHNPQVTLMRTNAEECAQLGRIIAEKANANQAPTAILNPLKTVSVISAEGQPFHDSEADEALFGAIREYATVEVIDYDEAINSETFAKAAAHKLLELMAQA